jgi:transcriptional regulator with XRE-family HTH domain
MNADVSLPVTRRSPRRSVRGRLPSGQPNPVDVHIGQQMRTQRLSAGLSQANVGDAIGVAFQQIQKYENALNRVSASRLWQLSMALGCPVDLFFKNMTADTAAASPRYINEHSLPAQTVSSQPDGRIVKEGAKLVRAFKAIKADSARRQLLLLAMLLAESAP